MTVAVAQFVVCAGCGHEVSESALIEGRCWHCHDEPKQPALHRLRLTSARCERCGAIRTASTLREGVCPPCVTSEAVQAEQARYRAHVAAVLLPWFDDPDTPAREKDRVFRLLMMGGTCGKTACRG